MESDLRSKQDISITLDAASINKQGRPCLIQNL